MKTFAGVLVVVILLAAAVIAYAHGPGTWGGGFMSGPGYGQHMMGPGYGGHMMGSMTGWAGRGPGSDPAFLDETREARKELHEKKFEYFEAVRDQDTAPETIAKLEKEINKLQDAIAEKTPSRERGRYGGFGCR